MEDEPRWNIRNRKIHPTEAQWLEIERRYLAGETVVFLAKEFKVSREALYYRFGNRQEGGKGGNRRIERQRTLAAQVAKVETAMQALPISEQVMVRTLADHLKSISCSLAGAAAIGAQSAHKLSAIAHSFVNDIGQPPIPATDTSRGVDDNARLMSAQALTGGANEAAKIGLNLLAANKEALRELPGNVYDITPKLMNEDDQVAASRTYQRLVAGVK